MTQKVQLFKAQKTEKYSWYVEKSEEKEKSIPKRKLIDKLCESSTNTVAEELASSENMDLNSQIMGSYILMMLSLLMMDEVYHQFFLNQLSYQEVVLSEICKLNDLLLGN